MIIKYSEYIKENVNNNQFFTTYQETKRWLDEMEMENYTINQDLTVDVNDDVNISERYLEYIPVQFGIVKGSFDCSHNDLTTLIGSPKEVGGNFYCDTNHITSLEGLSSKIDGYFSCYNNKLITLEGYNIYHLKKNIKYTWYRELNPKIKEEYFDKNLEENPEIFSLINFKTSKKFKDKWSHLFNANKFDLI